MTDSILIIGTEPSLREELVSAFTRSGFTMAYVASYPEALLKLSEFSLDLVIMNTVLPTRDGFEACSELRSILGIPVVLLGEDSSDKVWEKVMEADADHYQIKPCQYVLELVTRVKAILRRYRSAGSRSDNDAGYGKES